MSVRVVLRDGESFTSALKRFRKILQYSGLAWEANRRAFHQDGTEQMRTRQFRKRFKVRQATLIDKQSGRQPVDSLAEAESLFWKRTGKP